SKKAPESREDAARSGNRERSQRKRRDEGDRDAALKLLLEHNGEISDSAVSRESGCARATVASLRAEAGLPTYRRRRRKQSGPTSALTLEVVRRAALALSEGERRRLRDELNASLADSR